MRGWIGRHVLALAQRGLRGVGVLGRVLVVLGLMLGLTLLMLLFLMPSVVVLVLLPLMLMFLVPRLVVLMFLMPRLVLLLLMILMLVVLMILRAGAAQPEHARDRRQSNAHSAHECRPCAWPCVTMTSRNIPASM